MYSDFAENHLHTGIRTPLPIHCPSLHSLLLCLWWWISNLEVHGALWRSRCLQFLCKNGRWRGNSIYILHSDSTLLLFKLDVGHLWWGPLLQHWGCGKSHHSPDLPNNLLCRDTTLLFHPIIHSEPWQPQECWRQHQRNITQQSIVDSDLTYWHVTITCVTYRTHYCAYFLSIFTT